MSSMADALSAAGLLLAALALVYSAWSAEIDEAINKPMGTTDGEIKRSKDEVRAVLKWRASPLLLASSFIFAVFIARDLRIVASVRCFGQSACTYDDIASVFLLTQLLVCAFMIHLIDRIRKLRAKL